MAERTSAASASPDRDEGTAYLSPLADFLLLFSSAVLFAAAFVTIIVQ